MLSRFGAHALAAAGGFMLAGIAMANVSLIGLAVGPLLALLLAAFVAPPKLLEGQFELDRRTTYVGQAVRIQVRATVDGRWGPLDLHVRLPAMFELAEGSNYRHVWITPGRRTIEYEFSAKCTRRGVFTIDPIEFESTHPTLMGAAVKGEVGVSRVLRVRPRWARLQRVRTLRSRSKSMIPEMDLSQTGTPTTEFEEIREYHWGDSPRSINWKASARLGETRGRSTLLVNEYEREGKKIVWLFIDATRSQMIGTSLDNAFERRVEAAFAIGSLFLKRGYTLGLSVFNHDTERMLLPDSGGTQRLKLTELLTRLIPTDPVVPLLKTVDSARPYLVARKTLAYVITSIGSHGAPLEDGLRLLRNRIGHRRGRVPVVVIHINPYGLVPFAQENGLARVTNLLQKPRLRQLHALGVRTIDWDPSRIPLGGLLRRVMP